MPIPGTRRMERVTQNNGAANLVLAADDLREIEATSSKISIEGARLPEAILQFSYR